MPLTISQRLAEHGIDASGETNLDDLIADTVSEVISELPQSTLWNVATAETVDASTGFAHLEGRILRVYVEGVKCEEIFAAQQTRYNNFQHPASGYGKPIYYRDGGSIYCRNGDSTAAGTCYFVSFPTVVSTDTAVSGWPSLFTRLLTLRLALEVKERQIHDLKDTLPTAVSAGTLPTAPSAPSFTYSAASAGSASASSVSAGSSTATTVTLPTGDLPSWSDQTDPTVVRLFDADGSYALGLDSQLQLSAMATLSNLEAINRVVYDGVAGEIALKIDEGGTPSDVGIPKFDISTDLPTLADVFGTNEDPNDPDQSYTSANAGFGLDPDYTATGDDWENYRDEEDPEMMASLVDKFRTILQERAQYVEERLAIFNKELAVWTEQVRETFQQQGRQQELLTLGINQDVQRYRAEIEAAAVETRTNLQRITQLITADGRIQIDEYAALVANQRQKFDSLLGYFAQRLNAAVVDANNGTQSSVVNARLTTQAAQATAQLATSASELNGRLTTDTNLRNAEFTYRAQVEEYSADLSLFDRELANYQAEQARQEAQFATAGRLFEYQVRTQRAELADLQRRYQQTWDRYYRLYASAAPIVFDAYGY